jgi:hypothetical protein
LVSSHLVQAGVRAQRRNRDERRQAIPGGDDVGKRQHGGIGPQKNNHHRRQFTKLSDRTANRVSNGSQPVVKVWRGTETGEAPRGQGATMAAITPPPIQFVVVSIM